MRQLTQPTFKEGLTQGLEQGIAKGQARLLIKLLTHRFGDLPEEVGERIASADSMTLERWSDLVLEAADLGTLLNDPMARGIEEGIVKGQAGLLTRQLTRRFGSLPEDVTERIASADRRTLDRWSDLLLEATDLNALFGDLSNY